MSFITAFQGFKRGMQCSSVGMWKGYHFSIKGIRKVYLFCGASSYKTLLSALPPPREHMQSSIKRVLWRMLLTRVKNVWSRHVSRARSYSFDIRCRCERVAWMYIFCSKWWQSFRQERKGEIAAMWSRATWSPTKGFSRSALVTSKIEDTLRFSTPLFK